MRRKTERRGRGSSEKEEGEVGGVVDWKSQPSFCSSFQINLKSIWLNYRATATIQCSFHFFWKKNLSYGMEIVLRWRCISMKCTFITFITQIFIFIYYFITVNLIYCLSSHGIQQLKNSSMFLPAIAYLLVIWWKQKRFKYNLTQLEYYFSQLKLRWWTC